MAEYLAPAVYVEEVDSGPKPIEGVSTSTAGMVGVTERGPRNVPILVTSIGDYERWFGGRLPRRDFVDPVDADRAHCYLPHAVEGFFTNGGKRAYIVSVAPDSAQRAGLFLYDRGKSGGAGTILLRRAGLGGGLSPEPQLYLLDTTGIASTDTLRIGSGSAAEYHPAAGAPTPATQHVALSAPLGRAHAAAAVVSIAAAAPGTNSGSYALATAAAAGATTLIVDTGGVDDLTTEATPFLIEVSTDGTADIAAVLVAAVVAPGVNHYRVTLNEPLGHAHAAGATVKIFKSKPATDALDVAAAPGDPIAFTVANNGFANAIVEIDRGNAAHEARRRGDLKTFALAQPLTVDAPVGSSVSQVALTATTTVKALSAAAAAGSRVVTLGNRVGLAIGDVLSIGAFPNDEFAAIVALPGSGGAPPDAGAVTLSQPLGGTHANAAVVTLMNAPAFPSGGHQDTQLIFDAATGADTIIVGAGQAYVSGEFVRLRRPDGAVSYHRLGAPAGFAATGRVALATGLARTHERGEPAVERAALIQVQALDTGDWGNRLLISTYDEPNGLAVGTQTTLITPPLEIRVVSLTGIEAGTLLEVTSASGGSVLLKVRRINRANRSITFDPPGLDGTALGTLGGGPFNIRSREFAITVRLMRPRDLAVPSRDTMVIATETFGQLSLDERNGRYFAKVIGDINGPRRLEDRRPEGESALIRVAEADITADTTTIRPGPEALIDRVPSGGIAPARHAMSGGDDSITTIGDAIYLGTDDVEPINRTGLYALKSIQNVSIVAVPGQASAALQAGVIAHCELMRYRFAVLDSAEPDASLADVQQQRQTFDTKYAGLYYPWLTIPDPHPDTLTVIRDFPLPPSGHMIGIYARTDEERGVHKAPANEVVRGVTGLTRRLNKGEHDILNPSPVNINVIRDFRPDGRGIRAWGARCITSDSDHKYVPVRRLLIFVEQSIERGLQWVVFEPNSDALWARVRRTIRNFLTDVWRSGALEGVKPEEAFFVKCDRTTMTQSDIDSGRLICVIGIAPVKPAEFVIVRIGFWTANAEAEA